LDTVLGENTKYRESAERVESLRVAMIDPGGQCVEGGKCARGRHCTEKRINPLENQARERENK
jgi:hypothetical protein